MTAFFDVIVVGSGPAGVSAALPLVEAGLRVHMVDGGKQPDTRLPMENFLSARTQDVEQWKWIVGSNFHRLSARNIASPKFRVPSQAFVFEDFTKSNQIISKNFMAIGSLAKGGLSNAWGCGVAQLSEEELTEFPLSISEMKLSYARVSQRIGISGNNDDDMAEYFGKSRYLQTAIRLDETHARLLHQYEKKKSKLHSLGFKLGRSRLAVLTTGTPDRLACNLSNNCLYGCSRGSMYSSLHDLHILKKYKNFTELSGFIVDEITRNSDSWMVISNSSCGNKRQSIKANLVIMAAGTLASTRLILNFLDHRRPVPLLSNPTAAFMVWLPKLLGARKLPGFGLGQLSFNLLLSGGISAFGSTFSTTGIPLSEFAGHIPMGRRYSIDMLNGLLNSCIVGNLFLPGHLTIANATINETGSLMVSGAYDNSVAELMNEAKKMLSKVFLSTGSMMLLNSFTMGPPGGDVHYSGTLPMRHEPTIGETSTLGEVKGMNGVYVVDGSCLPLLTEKSHTLTIMANADRIGRALALNLRKG